MVNTSSLQIVVYVIGLLLMLSVLVIGPSIETDLKLSGLSAYIEQTGGLPIFYFVFIFPLGLLVCVVAGLLTNRKSVRFALVVIAVGIAIASLVIIWPSLTGRESDGTYFAIGGTVLLFLISATAWYWARLRRQAMISTRRIIDLQGVGYFCFAMATWHSCGAGGLPGFAIYPDDLDTVKQYPFKVVMLYFILAWLSILSSYFLKVRSEQ